MENSALENSSLRKSALITGASRGIGRACALALAGQGYHLYLTCRSRMDLLEELREEIVSRFPVTCRIFQCDAGSPAETERLFSQIEHLTLLVNNAGMSYIGLLTDMSLSDWDVIMKTNLNSVFYTSRLAIPLFLKQGYGRILNISSVWGSAGASMEVAYSASKGGVNAFTKALAKELAPSNIPVNALACGMIDTEMNGHFTEEELSGIRAEIPADRIAIPDEVANMICQLAEAPTYLTGQIITFDGGWT